VLRGFGPQSNKSLLGSIRTLNSYRPQNFTFLKNLFASRGGQQSQGIDLKAGGSLRGVEIGGLKRTRTESEIIKRSSLANDLRQHSTIVEPKTAEHKRFSMGNEDISQHSLMQTRVDCGDQGSVSSEILEKKQEKRWVSNTGRKVGKGSIDSDQEFDIHFDNLYEAYMQRGQIEGEPKKKSKGEETVNPDSGKASSDKNALKSKEQANHKAVLMEDFDIGIELGLGESMSDSSDYKSQNDGKPIPGKINIFWDDGHSVQVDGQIIKKTIPGQFDNLTAKSQATMIIAPKDLMELQHQEFERTNNLLYKEILKSFRFWVTFVILTFS
jgi:hypothetical protein